MTPNLIINLDIEPITLMWNGQAISLPGTYELVPDEMVKHLHRRVMAIALHERKRYRSAAGWSVRRNQAKGPSG